jgi:hypothetical protein
MAATTTNYGFDVPTSSDLVKNGATQIALLGQDLDTFLFRPFTRNGALNSQFNVWQRGTSISYNNENKYSADRWQAIISQSAASITRQVTGDTTNLPFIQYCARVQRTAGNTQTNEMQFAQSFETVNSIPYAGKTVTFSFYARKGANYSTASDGLQYRLVTGTGTDQSVLSGFTGANNAILATATLTTTWQRFTASTTLPATTTQIGINFVNTPTGTAGANDYYEVTGVMLEVGNQASPYTPAGSSYQAELAACQRYYQRYSSSVADPYTHFFLGLATSTTQVRGILTIPPMRTKIIDMSYGGNFTAVGTTGALTLQGPGTQTTGLNIAVTGATTNQVYAVYANNDANAYFAFNAEL